MTAEAVERRSLPRLRAQAIFAFFHLIPLAALWTNVTGFDWVLCIALYFVRMFFVTGFYHRYFSHRTYKTSRAFQFIMAFLAQTSCQKGALWWAANHRVHHKHSDTEEDPHSANLFGFWYSHIGWIIGPDYLKTRYDLIPEFAKYPELRWLNRNHLVPPLLLAIGVTMLGGIVNGGSVSAMFSHGLSTLLIGFFLSTVILFHGVFSVNSLMHIYGKPRYQTGDLSKNSWWLALVTLGEGWHNNHHYYQSSTRQGFFWWEYDITYYIIKLFSWIGLVWDIRGVPKHIKYSKSKEHARELAKEFSSQG